MTHLDPCSPSCPELVEHGEHRADPHAPVLLMDTHSWVLAASIPSNTGTTAAFQWRPFQYSAKIIFLGLMGPMEVRVGDQRAKSRQQRLRLKPLENLMPRSMMFVGP